MRRRTTAICWIASVVLTVQGPLLARGGGKGGGGFHSGSIGNAGHVTNPVYYPGGSWGYAMGPTTFEGDEDLNPRGGDSAAVVSGRGSATGPPEELQDGRGVYVPRGVASPEGPSWDSDWWGQDPRTEAEIAADAAAADARVGSAVSTLPRSYDAVYAANARYYFAEGAFYQKAGSGYQVVTPPIGIEVAQVPRSAEMVKVKGQHYFVYHDIYYQALYGGSGIIYRVVEDPNP